MSTQFSGSSSDPDVDGPVSVDAFMKKVLAESGGPVPLALRGYRCREGLNQREVAASAGVSAKILSAMERGKRPVTQAEAKRLAKVLNCNWQRLVPESE